MLGPTEGFSKSIGSGFRLRMVSLLRRSACLPQDCALVGKRRDEDGRHLAPDTSRTKRRCGTSWRLEPAA